MHDRDLARVTYSWDVPETSILSRDSGTLHVSLTDGHARFPELTDEEIAAQIIAVKRTGNPSDRHFVVIESLVPILTVALRNEFGGVTRTVNLEVDDEGTSWQYRYDEAHREAYPATRKSVQVRMLSGEWVEGTIL